MSTDISTRTQSPSYRYTLTEAMANSRHTDSGGEADDVQVRKRQTARTHTSWHARASTPTHLHAHALHTYTYAHALTPSHQRINTPHQRPIVAPTHLHPRTHTHAPTHYPPTYPLTQALIRSPAPYPPSLLPARPYLPHTRTDTVNTVT